jgi:hypothetical protein
MKRAGAIVLVAVLLVLAAAVPGDAGGRRHRHHHHGFRSRVFFGVGLGPAFWWGAPTWYYPPPAYVYSPPPVVIREPPVYVQQAPATGPLEEGYWYYCQSARAYYPTAPSCAEPWVKVPPRAP